jgi:hypothetical protein
VLDELPEGATLLGLHSDGTEVYYTKVYLHADTDTSGPTGNQNVLEQWIGIYEWHRCKDRDGATRWDGGYVPFDVAGRTGTTWTVNSYDPLDLHPSILHPDCGFHGFIRQGKWVPA